MRYSMLVYITKMGRTLLEAAQYLRTAPAGDPLRQELLENGRQMLAQIEDVLEQHRDDLRSEAPLDCLSEIEALWNSCGEGLEKHLGQLVQDLPGQVFYQVRAVFFAELGEKWDAMESVYEYMRDDPRFDPIVVRTPVGRVVERNGKREQEIIYKDFLTPMGIPSLGYDEYNIEADCPELAFISQPYESCTLEQFWPENIAEHTRLVYLPYFMQDFYDNEDIFPLAKMPVYHYAWKVACPNQNQYRFYCRYAKNRGSNALLTGLPKLDPLVPLQTRGAELPCGWEKIKGKTVFLWNTWYSFDISSIQYLPQILEWFRMHPDCALIWREHPMTKVVTKLHFPEQYPHYKEMCAEARKVENVIIDGNLSFHAAFYWSNALISDYSSLISQYLLMDKPTLWIISRLNRYVNDANAKTFIDDRWLEKTKGADGIFDFLDRVRNGIDSNGELRKQIRQRDLPLADGHCAERVSDAVWLAMHSEDGLPTKERTEKNECKNRLDKTVSSS